MGEWSEAVSFITLVLILFPVFTGLFLLVRWGVGKRSDPRTRWRNTGKLNRTRRKLKGLRGAVRHIPAWLWISAVLGILWIGQFSYEEVTNRSSPGSDIVCSNPDITDGDTFRCDGQRIRLEGIDAPEMPGHCRKGRSCTPGDPHAAKNYLESISRGSVTCRPIKKDAYGRTVARCEAGGRDLSCAMIASGHAVPRYGNLFCP